MGSPITFSGFNKIDWNAVLDVVMAQERQPFTRLEMRDNPCSVVLFDEIEKASPSLLYLFLQAFDEGWLTDGHGKRVYLSDAIVIMTSNLGSEHFRKLTSPLGFWSGQVPIEQIQGDINREVERRFPPEFRNRIDEIVLFQPLTLSEAREIALQYVDQLAATLGQVTPGRAGGAGEAGAGWLQPRLWRAIPQTRGRRADQAAHQLTLARRVTLSGSRPWWGDPRRADAHSRSAWEPRPSRRPAGALWPEAW